MTKSILNDIKQLLGVPEDYHVFDMDVLIHINSVFSTLYDLGVGPKEPFYLEEGEEVWEMFMEDNPRIHNIKSYIYLRVRLLFDPPQNAFLVTAMEKQIKELEWRLTIQNREEAWGQNGS